MLKLEKMQIVGFKSFMDKTDVIFPDGITAVVGPNGCGKSNIGDAISWVLGEQSVKSLRGIRMEDVIFNGSEGKRPLGMAEVSLKFLSKNGSGENGSEEIVLTRRLFRSGESEYILNGEKCRLKDIKNLLSDLRIGAKTCAVIEQGRVEEIMNAKPTERRLLIEEAAGILGYKGKRKLAEMKLEATKANLLRVQDIIVEVERQMNSLRRQASKARRFTRLNDAKRMRQSELFVMRHNRFDSELRSIDSILGDLKMKEAQFLGQLGILEATIERNKQDTSEKEESLSTSLENAHLLDREIGMLEAHLRSLEEKKEERASSISRGVLERESFADSLDVLEEEIVEKVRERVVYEAEKFELTERISQRESSLKDLKERENLLHRTREEERDALMGAAQSLAESKNGLKMHENERAKVVGVLERRRGEIDGESERINLLKRELGSLEERTAAAERTRADLHSRIESLNDKERLLQSDIAKGEELISKKTIFLNSLREKERFFASSEVARRDVGRGTRAILDNDHGVSVSHRGIAADWIKSGSSCARAVESYIGDILPALVVDGIDEAVRGMKLLRSASAGAGKFLFTAPRKEQEEMNQLPDEIRESGSFIGRLSDKIECTDGIMDILGGIASRCIVVKDIDAARSFCITHPELDYVTLEGEVIRSGCIASMQPDGDEEQGILTRREKLESLRKEIEKLEESLLREREENGSLKRKLSLMTDEKNDIQQQMKRAEDEMLLVGQEALRVSDQLSYAEKNLNVLNEETNAAEEELAMIQEELAQLKQAAARWENELATRETSAQQIKAEMEEIQASIEQENNSYAGVYTEFVERSERLASLDAELVYLKGNREEILKKIDGSLKNEEESNQTITRLLKESANAKKSMEKLLVERKELQDHSEAFKREIISMKESVLGVESELKKVRADLEVLRESMKERELSRASVNSDLKHNSESCIDELGKEIGELLSRTVPASGSDEDQLIRQIADLNETIQTIGPINMMAMEEYDKLEERFKFLSTQRKDLTDSMESLTETIRKINQTSRERFVRAFETVKQNFNETFTILFGGGRADLRLDEEIDILETGLTIIAQPPGKRLQNINLMSGGEKALTAIALLFAVFRYQPSPFCLLDEADAPLDDLNVGRYLNLLKEFSDRTQFILITHNKRTMEMADLLYGVTMEEPGISKVMSLKLN